MPQRHLLTFALLACALFLRAAVPTGWMPAQGAGAFAIEPCPAAGPVAAMHMSGPEQHRNQHHSPATQHNTDCAFQPFSVGVADISAAVPLPRIVSNKDASLVAPISSIRATGPPALLPPATGPPANA